MDMEVVKSDFKLARRQVKTESTTTIGIAAITAIEIELNRLKIIFSAASFGIAEHDIRALSNLFSKYAQLKLEVTSHFQKLKSNAINTKKLVSRREINLNAGLETEILNLKIKLEKLKNKLFKKPLGNRHIL